MKTWFRICRWVHWGFLTACLLSCGCGGTTPVQTVQPSTGGEEGRWVILHGANNTRDLGGYKTMDGRSVRWKMVYRSGELSSLSDAGCSAFRALNAKRVVDYRNRLSTSPLFGGDMLCVLEAAQATLLPVHVVDVDPLTAQYGQAVQDNSESYRKTFELLADSANLPLLFHCAAGKDRTGIMAALLLNLLGVDRQSIIDDYMLSNLVGAEVDEGRIIGLLDDVDAQGGIESYLSTIGVSPETQAAVRANLLE